MLRDPGADGQPLPGVVLRQVRHHLRGPGEPEEARLREVLREDTPSLRKQLKKTDCMRLDSFH